MLVKVRTDQDDDELHFYCLIIKLNCRGGDAEIGCIEICLRISGFGTRS